MYDRAEARQARLSGTAVEETWRLKPWHLVSIAIALAVAVYLGSYGLSLFLDR